MSYTIYDFSESVAQMAKVPQDDGRFITLTDISGCVAAHGEYGDCAEWNGGFLLRLKDGRHMYLTGWCDTTGWGCQDGIELRFVEANVSLKDMDPNADWDMVPADINRYIRGETNRWDDPV